MALYSIRKTQKRIDEFNKFTDEYNKDMPNNKQEFIESKLFDLAIRFATKYVRLKRAKRKQIKQDFSLHFGEEL
jgi:hypothetical protein